MHAHKQQVTWIIHEINANIELELAQEQFQNNICLVMREDVTAFSVHLYGGVCRERLNLFLQERVIFRTTQSADSSPHMLTNNVSFAKHYQVSQCEKQLFVCWHGNTPRVRERGRWPFKFNIDDRRGWGRAGPSSSSSASPTSQRLVLAPSLVLTTHAGFNLHFTWFFNLLPRLVLVKRVYSG